jgi:hypothetical protein
VPRQGDDHSLFSDRVSDSARLRRGSRLLRHFLADATALPVHCAWCRRIQLDGEFVAAEEFLRGDFLERLRRHASHTICPDCLAAELKAADAVRAARCARAHASMGRVSR